ncbi:MAG TPA: YIP1 family protein [Candidatus Acidoferrales bacterium]|nr:YIP1 family protein [Candidatus Acidoferrales bacterium]
MSEQTGTSDHSQANQPDGQEKLSFMDKAAGVFYEPSRVFQALKTSPVKVADWLVPVALLAIVIGVSTYVRFSSPDLRFQMAQQQEQRFDKMVNEGKMTADQAEQAKERMENGSSAFMGIGIFGAVVATFIIFFAAAGVWVLIGKIILKGDVNYSQMMGVAGLASWISVVGVILSIVITVVLSRLDGGLHLGMFMQMSSDKTYSLLRSADLFAIWNLAASSIGIGTLSGKKGFLPAAWVFGIWIVIVLIAVFVFGGMYGG